MVIAYAVINTEGKMEHAAVKDSPDPLLSERVLAALRNWTFKPAQVDGQNVAAKALFGIPVWSAEQE
jgi:hypothetical protein